MAGSTLLAPRNIRGGRETGTGEKLARFILEDLQERLSINRVKLLYLTGDKNRDVLPNILRDGAIELQPLQVYKTQGASTLPQDLHNALSTVPYSETCPSKLLMATILTIHGFRITPLVDRIFRSQRCRLRYTSAEKRVQYP